MGESNPTQITEPVKEPVINNPQEPTTPPVAPPVEPKPEPVADPKQGGEPNDVIELISKADKSILLKSEVVQSLLENARQQEKNKLYKTIEDKENTIKQLNDTIVDLQNQLKTKEDLSMEGEKALMEQIKLLQENQEKLVKDMEKKEEETRLAKLETYKSSKIQEANGEIIVGLVRGNTEEEIDASIEVAKAEYEKITAPLKQQIVESAKPNKANAPKPTNPSTPPSDLEFTSEQIKAMSREEYAQYREKLLKSATAR